MADFTGIRILKYLWFKALAIPGTATWFLPRRKLGQILNDMVDPICIIVIYAPEYALTWVLWIAHIDNTILATRYNIRINLTMLFTSFPKNIN